MKKDKNLAYMLKVSKKISKGGDPRPLRYSKQTFCNIISGDPVLSRKSIDAALKTVRESCPACGADLPTNHPLRKKYGNKKLHN